MKQQDHIKELLKLIEENPDLPVVAWVHNEVVGGEEYGRWLGYFSKPRILEFILVEMYGDAQETVYKDKTEAYEDFLADTTEMTDEEIAEFINNIQWTKAIAVNIDLPE